ncbi:MAG TPA: phosphodiester glycosidase family protein [Anaerolineales bacterium]
MKPQFFLCLGMMVLVFVAVTSQVQSAPLTVEPATAGSEIQTSGQAIHAQGLADTPTPPQPAEGAAIEAVADEDGWVTVATGIAYKKFHLKDPNKIHVARMERGNPDVILESSIGQGRLASGKETVSGMAKRYDQVMNYWGGAWGARNKVVVAVNGYYFEPISGVPYQGQIHSGWYAKRFDDCQTGSGGSGFAWKSDRSAFIGGTVSHPEDKQSVTFLKSGKIETISGINVSRGTDQLILYTPQYDSDTNTDDYGVEVLVELLQPDLLSKGLVTGIVREIRNNAGSTPIPFDHVVLSANGTAKSKLLNNVEVGDEIAISHKIKDFVDGCGSAVSSLDWNGAYASIGGAFYFLKDGEVYGFPNDSGATARHPRTAIAYNEEYIYFIVVDGRDPYLSIGMTIAELGAFTRDTLGAHWGIAQDGGGSSTMVINNVVMNNTYCNNVFCSTKIYLPLTVGGNTSDELAAELEAEQPSALAPAPYPAGGDSNLVLTTAVERLVANGMLMVVVEPVSRSERYAPGSSIRAVDQVEIRLGPGTNYGVLAYADPDAEGIVVDHLNQLNGVYATGSYWWKVNLNGATGWVTGWVKEEALAQPGS